MQQTLGSVAATLKQFETWNCQDVRDVFDDLRALIATARKMPGDTGGKLLGDTGGKLLAQAMDLLDKVCSAHWPHTMMETLTYWAVDNEGRMIVSSDLFGEPRILGGFPRPTLG